MNRRVFLRNLSSLSITGIAAVVRPTTLQTGANIQRFKVVENGRFLVSNNGGLTWPLSISLGPDIAVTGIFREVQDIHLALSFQGHAFVLRSVDGTTWRTLD